ncbi:peptidoglycan-associated lipoprotein Pal [Endothiovibrio diazotrophicus]
MRTWLKVLMLVGSAALLSACGSTGGTKDEAASGPAPVDDRGASGYAAEGGAETAGIAGGGGFDAQALNDPASALSQRTIYFEYDSAEVSAEGREILAAHAAYLAANPGVTLVLEGHGDERGSREYNIALGERRAMAVRTLMLFLGALEDQLQTVSYGEEKPVALGHDEESWRLNRRVELIYPEVQQ